MSLHSRSHTTAAPDSQSDPARSSRPVYRTRPETHPVSETHKGNRPRHPEQGEVALVCGASRGPGRALAFALAASGLHVVALAREQAALEDLGDHLDSDGRSYTLVAADVTQPTSITRVSEAINARWGRLRLLVDCIRPRLALSPVHGTALDQWQRCIDAAILAKAHIIGSMDPLLSASGDGRAAFLLPSTQPTGFPHTADENPRPHHAMYAVSRAAVRALVHTYAAEVEPRTIVANLLDIRSDRLCDVDCPAADFGATEDADVIGPRSDPDWHPSARTIVSHILRNPPDNGQTYTLFDTRTRNLAIRQPLP